MALIRFNDVGEFLAELSRDRGLVEHGIVRLTNRATYSNAYPIRHLSVVATCIMVRPGVDHMVRLETFVGQLWGFEKEDKEAYGSARAIHDQVEQRCSELGLEVRAGVLEMDGRPGVRDGDG
jgi:hypothetical protein